jgi:hypothetical protein
MVAIQSVTNMFTLYFDCEVPSWFLLWLCSWFQPNCCGISFPANDWLFVGGQLELVVLIVMSLLGFCCGCVVAFNSCVVSSPTYDRYGETYLWVDSQSW